MATKKTTTKKTSAASTKKTAPKSAASKTTVRTVSAVEAAPKAPARKPASKLEGNTLNIVLAELVGTFVLTMVALMTASDVVPLFVGLTLALLVMSIGMISGSHVNPAVTFGLWVAGKAKAVMLPFYWGAQFLGAMAAFVVLGFVSSTGPSLDFGHFNQFNWSIFAVEFVGTAVFLFGLVSVVNRQDLSNTGKALGIGLSLMIGIVVSGTLYATVRQDAINSYQKDAAQVTNADDAPAIPHAIYVEGATLNPAVALVATETTDSKLKGSAAADDEKHYSRLGWEVILSTLGGAALGALVARLLGYRFKV